MNLKEQYDLLSLESIQRFVNEAQEENLHLEFKTVNHPSASKEAKNIDLRNYSKSISAFANADGGLIVWGVVAEKNAENIDAATALKPINHLKSFLNFLNETEGDVVSPSITGINHKLIETEPDTGYAVTFVPKSEAPPHMGRHAGKQYYKRSGSSSYPCEHYDIADMFNRTSVPKLNLALRNPRFIPTGDYDEEGYRIMNFKVDISIINEGRCIAKYPFLRVFINFPFEFDLFGLTNWKTGLDEFPILDVTGRSKAYSGGVNTCIHTQAIVDIDIITIKRITMPLQSLSVHYNLHAENMPLISNLVTIPQSQLIELWQNARLPTKRPDRD